MLAMALLLVIGVFIFNIIIIYYLYVMFQLYLLMVTFRRHIELKLNCYIIVYLQTAGVKYCY